VTARDEVLGRIRQANALAAGQPARSAAPPAGARETAAPAYRTRGERDTEALMTLLAGRLADYRAVVRRSSREHLAAEITAALAARGARRIVIPAGLDLGGALPAGVEAVVDGGADGVVDGGPDAGVLGAAALDACDGAVTGAAVAIAETGTIVLDGSPDQGRRAITLVPDYHLCIVRAEQVVELVPEAVARLAARAHAPLTWISGPSATSDIELERVEGVHGPRTLEVILVGP
jgi:L-lactate dehydrogenase complex protein LldG